MEKRYKWTLSATIWLSVETDIDGKVSANTIGTSELYNSQKEAYEARIALMDKVENTMKAVRECMPNKNDVIKICNAVVNARNIEAVNLSVFKSMEKYDADGPNEAPINDLKPSGQNESAKQCTCTDKCECQGTVQSTPDQKDQGESIQIPNAQCIPDGEDDDDSGDEDTEPGITKIDIYWNDLTEAKKAEILAKLGDNGNWDVTPMATIELEVEP